MDSSYAKVSHARCHRTSARIVDPVIYLVQKYPLKICYIDDSSVNVAVGKKVCKCQ